MNSKILLMVSGAALILGAALAAQAPAHLNRPALQQAADRRRSPATRSG